MSALNSGTANSSNKRADNQRDWLRAHEALSRLARQRAALDAEEGRWLLAALRAAAHVHLGFGTFGEYVERLFGYKPRSTQEKLRVAEALEELPATLAALESGALSWSAVRELTRVAVAETEHAWLAAAQGKTVHQLESLIVGMERGALPSSAPKLDQRRHILRFEVTAETLCLFRDAIDKLQRDSGAALDDDSALMSMARQILGGPADEGRANYQIALSLCPTCNQGHYQAAGELVPVSTEIMAMGACDGQHLSIVPVAGAMGRKVASDAVEPAAFGAHVGAPAAINATGALSASAPGAPVVRSAPIVTGEAASGAEPVASRPPRERRLAEPNTRARQAIPPAIRRAVLRRDHHRCRVPGCRNTRFVDLHHIHLRSENGGEQAANLITLCGAHHRAAHRGELLVAGSALEGVSFRHADGSNYGTARDPRAAEVQATAFAALRNLGFREGETRRVLGEVGKKLGSQPPSLECILREALAQLS